MTRLAKAGIQNMFHVHDEYVLERPLMEGGGLETDPGHKIQEASLREVLLAPIPWLPNCPLDVEFKWRFRYG